jgi:hypothetical protein
MFKFLVGVLALIGCAAAAVALASSERLASPTGGTASAESSRVGRRPPRPRITAHPAAVTVSTEATFRFRLRRGRRKFICRIDRRHARHCHAPVRLTNLGQGRHMFLVRAVSRSGRRSRPARFRWQVVEPRAFTVSARTEGLRDLYPGAPPVELPLTVANPNPEAISVVSLKVSVTASPPDCPAAENLAVAPSSASELTPLAVPAGGTAELPSQGLSAPTIQLLNLPTNQDACQDGRFQLKFEGSAHG